MEFDKDARVQGFSWEECLDEFPEDEFPVLRRAVDGKKHANSTKIEWLTADRRGDFNYTQIFRKPFAGDETAGLYLLLRDIEDALADGERRLDYSGPEPVGYLGGCSFFDSDEPILRPLQDPVLLRGRIARDSSVAEWLAETSVMFLNTAAVAA